MQTPLLIIHLLAENCKAKNPILDLHGQALREVSRWKAF